MKICLKKTEIPVFTKKFALRVAALCSFFVIAQAVIFYFTVASNSKILRNTVIESNNNILLEKAKLICARLLKENPQNTDKAVSLLKTISTEYDDVLHIILFSLTDDDNYFTVSGTAPINSDLHIDLKKNHTVREVSPDSYLKKGRLQSEANPQVYSKNAYMWQNVYIPVTISSKKYVVQFMFRASVLLQITNSFNSAARHASIVMLISSALLILGITLLAFIFVQSHSLLLSKLTAYMRKTAEGDLDLEINTVGDHELDALAASFNTLIEEIKHIKAPVREEILEPEVPEKPDEQVLLLKRLFKKGVSLLKEKNANEAREIFEFIVTEQPENFGAYFNLGVALVKTGDYERSAVMFRKAHELNTENDLTEKYILRVEKIIERNAEAK